MKTKKSKTVKKIKTITKEKKIQRGTEILNTFMDRVKRLEDIHVNSHVVYEAFEARMCQIELLLENGNIPKPPRRSMTAKASGATYEQFKNNGWSDAQLITHGYMEP